MVKESPPLLTTNGRKAWLSIPHLPTEKAEAFREAVNDKNLQFVYSWKALNQVHIVGRRRNSPSGQALPAEILEFKALADEKDAAWRRHRT